LASDSERFLSSKWRIAEGMAFSGIYKYISVVGTILESKRKMGKNIDHVYRERKEQDILSPT
jgi:hypothetical protein